MPKLALTNVLAVACGLALAAGCGSDNNKTDATVKKDTSAKDTGGGNDGGPADAALDGAVDANKPDGGGDGQAVEGGVDAPKDVALDGTGAGDGGPAMEAGGDSMVLNAIEERGRYLVQNVIACSDCHTPRDPATGAPIAAKYLSGAECFVKLPNGHCLHTRNLTNDETGLKNRSAEDIKRMFLDGIRPTSAGQAQEVALNPVMPYYVFHNMSSMDADAIVAYLRTVPAVVHSVPARDVEFDVPMHANYLDPATIPTPPDSFAEKASALRGRYLATEAGVCIECHTQHNAPTSADVLTPANFFAGGERFELGFPVVPVSKNLTSDPTNGVGEWSVADIIKVLHQGKDRDGKGICPPMPVGPMGPFGGLTDSDATDIANYIKSLPPNAKHIDDMCSFPFPAPPDGGGDGGDGGATGDASSDVQD